MLDYEEAKIFYNTFGNKQDKQFYEKKAVDFLIEQGNFTEAKNIVEFGCGTGKLANKLLTEILPEECKYTGIDISKTMIELFIKNTKAFADRVNWIINNGEPKIGIPDNIADRFISAYVLDLLSENDTLTLIDEAYRILKRNGYLCLASITHGNSFASKIVEFIWRFLFNIKPSIVGGCRPISLRKYLTKNNWRIISYNVIVSYGIPSEVIIAEKLI